MNTEWTDQVDLLNPLPEYPRPQLARMGWMSLNGTWDYAINKSPKFPKEFDGEITVPFSPETTLSGVGRTLKSGEFLWYRRDIQVPAEWSGRRILLHFGAVDQIATVWVNSIQVAEHIGGYLPFEADVTDTIEDGIMSITVRVTDDTEKGGHTHGKQKLNPGGIWYTAQSGIWQTVWIEAVPESYIKSLRITPFFDEETVEISADIAGDGQAYAELFGETYSLPAVIPVQGIEPWTPENPVLHGFKVYCGEDEVQSYFAMRKFSVDTDENGTARLFLNNRPYFHNGVLDQGYWPDGLYTAPTDEALIYDISTAKAMGFNMIRKHVKVEPLRWYYHCDRLGMLVWQDMPNGGTAAMASAIASGMKDNLYPVFGRGKKENREEFKAELTELINTLYNCPCIAMWVIFNEGWGQFDGAEMLELVNSLDSTRTVDHASGWHDQGVGQFKSEHVYRRSYKYKPDKKGRAVVLSEFGGYGHKVLSHCYSDKYLSYKKFEMPAQLEIGIEELYQQQIGPAKIEGLAACVYTQLCDVENELNGIMTYDRKVAKIAPEIMSEIINVGD